MRHHVPQRQYSLITFSLSSLPLSLLSSFISFFVIVSCLPKFLYAFFLTFLVASYFCLIPSFLPSIRCFLSYSILPPFIPFFLSFLPSFIPFFFHSFTPPSTVSLLPLSPVHVTWLLLRRYLPSFLLYDPLRACFHSSLCSSDSLCFLGVGRRMLMGEWRCSPQTIYVMVFCKFSRLGKQEDTRISRRSVVNFRRMR